MNITHILIGAAAYVTRRSLPILTLAAITLPINVAQAAIQTLEFTDGDGDTLVDQYPGTAGDGWTGGWVLGAQQDNWTVGVAGSGGLTGAVDVNHLSVTHEGVADGTSTSGRQFSFSRSYYPVQ